MPSLIMTIICFISSFVAINGGKNAIVSPNGLVSKPKFRMVNVARQTALKSGSKDCRFSLFLTNSMPQHNLIDYPYKNDRETMLFHRNHQKNLIDRFRYHSDG